MTIRKAFYQTAAWIILGLSFGGFIWWRNGQLSAIQYISAYLMEWSLSIDNIFVFILIFNFFRIKKEYTVRALLLGILMAIFFRVIFITIGIAIVHQFYWVLYIFGAFLLFTGIRMFIVDHEEDFKPNDNRFYKLLTKILPITHQEGNGKYWIKENGRRYFTTLFVVVMLLASTDIVFALDSIPAVFAISQEKMIIYTSNIFAVLGLRSLFFLLRGAVNKFRFLQQGIAIVLIFIGGKMLAEYFNIHIHIIVSLMVIVVCLGGSILFSIYYKRIDIPAKRSDKNISV